MLFGFVVRNLPLLRTPAETNSAFLSLCSSRSTGDDVEVTLEPISARSLCNRKAIIKRKVSLGGGAIKTMPTAVCNAFKVNMT